MEITTKYNIWDKVYIMFSDILEQWKIQAIEIQVHKKIETAYFIYINRDINYVYYDENEIYSSKEEYIQTL